MVATLFSHRATQNEISVRLAFFIVFFFLKNLAEMQKLSGNVCSHFVKKQKTNNEKNELRKTRKNCAETAKKVWHVFHKSSPSEAWLKKHTVISKRKTKGLRAKRGKFWLFFHKKFSELSMDKKHNFISKEKVPRFIFYTFFTKNAPSKARAKEKKARWW